MISKLFFSLFIAPIIKYRYSSYRELLANPQDSQINLLRSILQNLSTTTYGKEHNILGNENYQDFIKKLPLNKYSELESYIEKERLGHRGTILKPSALIWEKTSGSSMKKKFIPYNRYALRDFRDMIVYWVGDLIQAQRSFPVRKIFFSLSMHLENESGIESDTDYLPWYFRLFFKNFLLLPHGLKKIKDPKIFNLWLCSHLLLDKSINILFFWSPTYFISLIEFISENQTEILTLIQAKELHYQGDVFRLNIKNKRSLSEIKNIMTTHKWNDIDTISCWVDGSSELFINELNQYFPNAHIQGKGLLATEAPLTFPSECSKGYLPLIENIFYEFIHKDHQILQLHQLEQDQIYEVVITNRSGLIRYQMNDLIQVTHFSGKTPCFKFISRTGLGSDLTGEKLDLKSIQEIFKKLAIQDDSFIIPIVDKPSYYVLVSKNHKELVDKIENELCQFYHYKQSRKLGQLDPLKFIHHESPHRLFNELYQSQGLKLGDIKFNQLFVKPILMEDLKKITQH
tara:strand:- start:89819 stop:91360 length:1542 start_codon:yes stop_codon:yes gene_type:complete